MDNVSVYGPRVSNNWDVFISQRQKNRNALGVALYIRSCLDAHQLHNQEFHNLDESVWCSVRLSTTSRCLVGVIYRKPTAEIEYDKRLLEGLTRSTRLGFSQILILGDFNLPRINFVEHTNSTEALFFNLIGDL